jgi:hypothetical protein
LHQGNWQKLQGQDEEFPTAPGTILRACPYRLRAK